MTDDTFSYPLMTHPATLHPRLADVLDLATTARAELLAVVDPLDVDTLSRRPAPDQWSPAEVLEHLRIVELGVVKLLRKLVPTAKANGLGAESDTSSIRHLLDDRHQLYGDVKLEAPEMVRPVNVDPHTVRAALEESRRALREAVALADGLALGEVTFPHPRLGTLNLYEWILFIPLHERRHLGQIRRALESISLAPTSAPRA
jgi:hypothetical protein